MKIKVEYITEGDEELILRIYQKNETTRQEKQDRVERILGSLDGETLLLMPKMILYFETVDGKVFAYLKNRMVVVPSSLEKLEDSLKSSGFVRISKSVVMNLNKVQSFQSMIGNRMIATMSNQEQLIVSRHYTKNVRNCLREGAKNE